MTDRDGRTRRARGRSARARVLVSMLAGIGLIGLAGCDSPKPLQSVLTGVSCPSDQACVAVGANLHNGDDNNSLIGATAFSEQGGSSFAVLPTPNPWVWSQLTSISCPAADDCIAVGQVGKPGTKAGDYSKAVSLRWNGSVWTALPTPTPTVRPGEDTSLVSVSCSSDTDCLAIGYSNGGEHPLAVHWNGVRWTTVASPSLPQPGTLPPGTLQPGTLQPGTPILRAVSCFVGGCMAVGYLGANDETGFVARWDGARWTTLRAAIPPSKDDWELEGVSCDDPTSCTAVGGHFDLNFDGAGIIPEETLVEHWDGTTWTVVHSPNPARTGAVLLIGVSCPAATTCLAVGGELPRLKNPDLTQAGALVGRWTGTRWTLGRVPLPRGATSSILLSVSCPTEVTCTAVGSYYRGKATESIENMPAYPLVERWTPSTGWRLVRSAIPRTDASSAAITDTGPMRRGVAPQFHRSRR